VKPEGADDSEKRKSVQIRQFLYYFADYFLKRSSKAWRASLVRGGGAAAAAATWAGWA
jgi:hypothetical protein